MIREVEKRRVSLSEKIKETCGNYLSQMQNIQDEKSHTGGLFLGFSVSKSLEEQGISAEDIRQSCLSLGEKGCAITVVDNVVRIVLIPEVHHKVFAERLKRGIERLVNM